jgi:hypothetical protein
LAALAAGAAAGGGFVKAKVVVFPGLIPILGMTGAGSQPKGELVQWADLIGALVRLGHAVTVALDAAQLAQALAGDPDRVFADYVGIKHFLSEEMRSHPMGRFFQAHRCRFRVLDIYGTDARFNDAAAPPAISGVTKRLLLPAATVRPPVPDLDPATDPRPGKHFPRLHHPVSPGHPRPHRQDRPPGLRLGQRTVLLAGPRRQGLSQPFYRGWAT